MGRRSLAKLLSQRIDCVRDDFRPKQTWPQAVLLVLSRRANADIMSCRSKLRTDAAGWPAIALQTRLG